MPNAEKAKFRLKDTGINVVWGIEGMTELVTIPEADTVLTSVGIAGLIPQLKPLRQVRILLLANKETLVTAGELVMEAAERE